MKHFSSLVVLVHGIDSPLLTKDTLSNLRICLLQQAGLRDCFIFQSRVNQGRTQDGIANLASRLVFEIEECCRENGLPKTELRISFIGHSLGGLVCRYAISMMSEEFEKKRFVPVSYIAIASPHLGVRRADTWMGKLQAWGGELLYGGSQTLDELMLRDRTQDGVPLLVKMSQGIFLQALAQFPHLTLVSAIAFDHQVTHCSSTIALFNQYDVGWSAFSRYAKSWISSKVHDRLVGFSGFDPAYEKVLAYRSAEKRHETIREFGSLKAFLGPGPHASRFKSHPHDVQRGFPEIESSHPMVVACARGLQTLAWRRMDFEVQSMFVHDTLVASPSISFCGVSNPTKYGWKVLVKIAKVLSIDHEKKI